MASIHSYHESILIPLSKYNELGKQLNPLSKQVTEVVANNDQQKLLDDTTIPDDTKMKLYTQNKHLMHSLKTNQKPQLDEPIKVITVNEDPINDFNIEDVVGNLNQNDAPFVRAILLQIQKFPNVIYWNSKYELIINGEYFPGSDLFTLLKYVLGNLVITSSNDVPLAAYDFIVALKEIGVPNKWLKISTSQVMQDLRSKKARRKGAKKGQWTEY